MKNVLHISTECYPAAKAGGMGDVVGSLPKYLNKYGVHATVIIPKYNNRWFSSESLTPIASGRFKMGKKMVRYKVETLTKNQLGFPFYCVELPGLFDRPQIYLNEDGVAFTDEAERNIAFQTSVLDWLLKSDISFDALHCHDHMTGLVPFMIRNCPKFKKLQHTPTFFTIHNGQYRGIWDWTLATLLPKYDPEFNGLLDWDGHINGLATAIKCAWQINTVSPSYMEELMEDLGNLTPLIRQEKAKASGILNGIDEKEWNPKSDEYLKNKIKDDNWTAFKFNNKKTLCKRFKLDTSKMLISFIGRFAFEKGADLLAPAIAQYLKINKNVNIVILGSGDQHIESDLVELETKNKENVAIEIAYNESLARLIYAGSDFLLMPSRFEPCGLNQMFSMRYGTIPVVRSTGGLKDTVPDINQDGNGIAFDRANIFDIVQALKRAEDIYNRQKSFLRIRDKIVNLDFSWNQSAAQYCKLYFKFI